MSGATNSLQLTSIILCVQNVQIIFVPHSVSKAVSSPEFAKTEDKLVGCHSSH